MKEILITSSVLIAAVLVIRLLFRRVLSRRVQYALWGLVLLRLLVPISLPAADFSLLSATAPVERAVAERLDGRPYYFRPQGQVSPAELEAEGISVSDVPTAEDRRAMIDAEAPTDAAAFPPQQEYLVRDPETDTVTRYAAMTVGPWEVLSAIWKTGMAVIGAWFLFSNGRFYWKLRKQRRVWEAAPYGASADGRVDDTERADTIRLYNGKRKVYLMPEGALPSPCLFGLFSPAI